MTMHNEGGESSSPLAVQTNGDVALTQLHSTRLVEVEQPNELCQRTFLRDFGRLGRLYATLWG